MLFKEFGNKNNPVIILLHGGGLSWWSLTEVIDDLKTQYHVIATIIDGHGEDGDTTFISIEDSAKKLISYIEKHHNGKVYALAGLSLGAQIVTEILSISADITEYAIIESALLYPIRGTTALTVPTFKLFYGLVKTKWFSKVQAKALFVPARLFEQYYQDSLKISKQSLINITICNGNYKIREEIKNSNAKVMIIVGGKELGIMKKSAKTIHEMIENSQLYFIKEMGHGEISLVHQKEYLELIKSLFNCKSQCP
jgi:pimeloyl-ACP methyl ester carboxylesterase